jgi:hypothetical protein
MGVCVLQASDFICRTVSLSVYMSVFIHYFCVCE